MVEIATGIQIGRRIRNLGRFAQIANTFARHGLWGFIERLDIKNTLTPEQFRRAREISKGEPSEAQSLDEIRGLPSRLRQAFEELGPAFVKLGQVLAVRQDLLPKEYTEEFSKLHSRVSALPYDAIKHVLEQELGAEKLRLIKKIDETPLAAGSIAQVHRVTLEDGREIVLKVQRPGIDQVIKVDLSLMKDLAEMIDRYLPETSFARPKAMVAEFSRALTGELDFIREGGNISKIRRNFANERNIVLPEVVWQLTTSKVLAQSYLEGIAASKKQAITAAGLDPALLVESGFAMFLKMVFIDGLYHGDLHPGNLLAMADNRVGVLDFGVVVHVSRSTRENLAGLLVALVQEDFERAVLHYLEMAEPALGFDVEAFEYEVGNAIAPFIGLSLEDIRSSKMFWDLARVAAAHGAPMPQELVIYVKTLVSFEGIGTHLDPGFDILRSAEKFTGDIVKQIYSGEKLKQQGLMMARDFGQLIKHAPFQFRRLLKATLAGDLKLNLASEDAGRLASTIDVASARLSVAIIIASLVIGSSILTFTKIAEQISSIPMVGIIGFSLSGLLAAYVILSILRGNR